MAGLQPISGIPPVAPSVSILTAARPLPAGVEWRSGVSWRSIADANAERYPDCDPSPARAETVDIGQPEFLPFNIAVPYACDWVDDTAEHEADARAALDTRTAWHLARELWTGETTGVGLATAASALADAAAHPVRAIAALLASWLDATQAGGVVLHVPAILIPSLFANGQIGQRGDVYDGPLGSVISPGPGYPNTGTATGPAGADAGAGNVWIYATGPVEYALGSIDVSETQSWNPRTNRYEIHAARRAIYRFDTSTVKAVKAVIPSGNPATVV